MKRFIIFLLTLVPFMAINAQELTEVMRIEKHDTVQYFKISDIKSFSFDMIEWIDIPTDSVPELKEPADSIPEDWGLTFSFTHLVVDTATCDTIQFTAKAVDTCYIASVTEEWTANLKDSILVITSPDTISTDYSVATVQIVAANATHSTKTYYLTFVCLKPLEEPTPETPADSIPELNYELRILTFEDEDACFTPYILDYAGADIITWSDLIDEPEYGGPLCYGNYMSCEYTWWDEGNTELTHTFPYNYYAYCFWGGGHAVSSYASTDYINNGYYENQLTVYAPEGAGGHGGSKNFCMHFGYKDQSPWNGTEYLPALSFADGEARIIDHMYVNNSTYAINCYMNGNGLTASIGEEDWVKLLATGYDADGNETGTVEFYMVNGPDNIITEWSKWDLSGLGAVMRVEFNVTGSSDNGYGYSQPAYFAYDDVAVRFKKK